jgi:hypothetical protein
MFEVAECDASPVAAMQLFHIRTGLSKNCDLNFTLALQVKITEI